ncbi:MAG: hypothetical protein JWO38_4813 [Gemmataceae bacterium]|nr:hypothetical protein [Gemmataceae bacterium]
MRRRLLLAGLGVATGLSPLFAQFPPPSPLPSSNPLPPARGPASYQPLTPPIQISRLPDPPNPQPPIRPPGSLMYPVQPAGGSIPTGPGGLPGGSFPGSPGGLPPGWSALPGTPGEPRQLPPQLMPGKPVVPPATPLPNASGPGRPGLPDGSTTLPFQTEMPLPYPEDKVPLDVGAVTLKRINGGWQVWAGQRVLKTLGDDEVGAKDVVRVLRELRPTEWAAIGSPRPVVEYGLTNGRPPVVAGFPRMVVPVDLRTVRVEPVKGVWCLRDDGNILFNFGLHKPDADQALAVVRKYGFNRVGMVGGTPAAPAMRYFFVSLDADGAAPVAVDPFAAVVQENSLSRTGIPVPGVGYVGEMVKIDPRKVEVRRVGADWVVAADTEVLARFGPAEWTARDAARVIQDGRFTEFCRVNAGLTFFLVNGQAPTHVPLSVQGRRYDLTSLKTTQLGPRWVVTENGRPLFDVGSPAEGEAVIRLLRAFQFDQVCQVGPTPRAGLVFLAKSR